MPSKDRRAARVEQPGADEALTELGRALAGPNSAPEAEPAAPGNPKGSVDEGRAEVELTMADLVSDDNGEIVFFNDSGFRSLGISTSAKVVADGQAGRHVTASGADVSGYKFVKFDNGLTFYFERELDLVLHRDSASG